MPQQLQVVRCYNCQTFQVQIVKKINKFECKICGDKQTVKKVYRQGSGNDCRLHVQKLNQIRVEAENQISEYEVNYGENTPNFEPSVNITGNDCQETQENEKCVTKVSKWSEFIETETIVDNNSDIEDSKYSFERPSKRKNNIKQNKNKKFKQSHSLNDTSENYIDHTEDVEKVNNKKPINKSNNHNKLFKKVNNSKWNTFVSDIDNTPGIDNIDNTDVDNNVNNTKLITKDQKGSFKKVLKKSKWDLFLNEPDNSFENVDSDIINLSKSKNMISNYVSKLKITSNAVNQKVSCHVDLDNCSSKNIEAFLKKLSTNKDPNEDTKSHSENNLCNPQKKSDSLIFSTQNEKQNVNEKSKWNNFIAYQSSVKNNEMTETCNTQKQIFGANIFNTHKQDDNLDDILDF